MLSKKAQYFVHKNIIPQNKKLHYQRKSKVKAAF